MANNKYDDKAINDFLELAQEIGITKAQRELGYPNSWSTAQRWAELRGIEVATEEIKARAARTREWYKTEEVILVAQEGFNRVYEELVNNNDLTPDDQKKLSEALNKHYQVWANAQGKATAITETRSGGVDSLEAHLQDLITSEKAKNKLMKENVSESVE